MEKFQTSDIPKSPRIQKLVDALYEHMPVIESARAKLITESYKETEGEPIITRRAKAFAHILHNIPIIIRDNELIVGSSTIAPRDVRHFRSSLMSGWKLNWIQLRPELRILLRLLRRPKPNLRRQISTGKGKQPVNLQLPIWHRKQSVPSITIFLHQEIISTMV